MTSKEILALLDNIIGDSVEMAITEENAGYYKGVLMIVWAFISRMIEKIEKEETE